MRVEKGGYTEIELSQHERLKYMTLIDENKIRWVPMSAFNRVVEELHKWQEMYYQDV